MNVKKFFELITPPILVNIRYRHKASLRHIWEGVYRHYRDVPLAGQGFDGDVYLNITSASTKRLLLASKNYGTIPPTLGTDRQLLPLLVSIISRKSRRARILDFGGGMGVNYIHLVNSLVKCRSVDYHIVERTRICDEGRRLFENDGRIHFHTSLPENLTRVDVVYMNSTLQYIEDYKGLIHKLADYDPIYFIYTNLLAGDIRTYATAQKNVEGSTIPYWFINVNEILDVMSTRRYSLIFKASFEREYNQSNFPEQYRLRHPCNLLFARL